MTLYTLDTNTFGPLVLNDAAVVARVLSLTPTDRLTIPATTAEETMQGRLAYVRRMQARNEAHLGQALHWFVATLRVLRDVDVLPYDEVAQGEFVRLRMLRLPGLGIQDVRVAAIARTAGAVLVTSEAAFKRVPGLVVEDWTQPLDL